jgi:hypothetical protein
VLHLQKKKNREMKKMEERLVCYGGNFEGGCCGLLKMERIDATLYIVQFEHCSSQGRVW